MATDTGYCNYSQTNYDCDGTCLNDTDADGICDEFEIAGCTDAEANNYDSDATDDDGSCAYPVEGCTIPAACNFNPAATVNDGSCDFDSCLGCLDAAACNFDGDALYNDQSQCVFPAPYVDCDGNCLNDADGDGVCDELEVPGCTDSNSPNFSPYATDDDGTCLVGGCTIPAACNFDSAADYLLLYSTTCSPNCLHSHRTK